MEKIYALIDKLQELRYTGADLQTISYYTQLLQAEVLHARNRQHQQNQQMQAQSNQGQIAVILPARQETYVTVPEPAVQTTTLPANKPTDVAGGKPETWGQGEKLRAEAAGVVQQAVNVPESAPEQEQFIQQPAQEPVKQQPVNLPPSTPVQEQLIQQQVQPAQEPGKQQPVNIPQSAPVQEQLIQQPAQPAQEPVIHQPPATKQPPTEKPKPSVATLFDHIEPKNNNGHTTPTSLNERLAQQQVELGQKLGQQRIHDLKSAIGINDKYQFISELFHNDSDLYERSIKTINEFPTLQDADRWIQREIKILQGWQDDHPLVQQFYSLLRKRFS